MSRARLDAQQQVLFERGERLAACSGRVKALEEALAAERAYAKDLAERALQMRKEGFEPPPPPPPEPEPELPEAVAKAIGERAFDPVTERQLRQYARQQLTTKEAAQVAADIMAGDNVEEEL